MPKTSNDQIALRQTTLKSHITATYEDRLKDALRLSLHSCAEKKYFHKAQVKKSQKKLHFEHGPETEGNGNCFYTSIFQAMIGDREMIEKRKGFLAQKH